MYLKKGIKGNDVRQLQNALRALGYNCGPADGIFGWGTEHQVEKFQEANELLPDGIVGPQTVEVINELVQDDSLKFKLGPDDDEPLEPLEKFSWVRVDADQLPGSGGYNRFVMREDAAKAYEAFRADVLALGGVISSAGAKRRLSDSKRSASRSTKSLHYTGLAFDMALDTGMNDPRRDRYVIEEVGDRKWNVWCKTDDESVPVREVIGTTYKLKKYKIEARMFSITELAQKHGFESIRARRSFMRGGSYLGAEWWHFQYEAGLSHGVSTFGGELLKLYTPSECSEFAHWNASKNCVWQVDWF
tara:strand:+ start:146 stop:1054 length:909 start_codon:yes stop_codon:yes gene_type:complete